MRIDNTKNSKSSFLSVEKDMSIIMTQVLKNDKLKKLLFYNRKGVNPLTDLNASNLTQEQTLSLIGKQLKILPKLKVDPETHSYIVTKFIGFAPNVRNPEFRDNYIEFDIVCHFDYWELGDFQLRPYKIAAELDSMFNKKHLTGIGELRFVLGEPFILNDEFGGFKLKYKAIHGEEDRTPEPSAEEVNLMMGTLSVEGIFG